nr:hypothetical protein [uncultured Acetatifactor sp.]
MGGTGYFGILARMWIVFPIYLKRIELGKDAFVYGIIFIATVFIATQFLKGLNGILGFSPTEKFGDWIWYINRGLYCYALGSILYCFVRDVKLRNCRKITLPFKALDTIVPGIACCAGFHVNPCEIFI